MRPRLKSNRSYQKLNVNFQRRKLKASKSQQQIPTSFTLSIYNKPNPYSNQSLKQESLQTIIIHIQNQGIRLNFKKYPLKRKHQYYQGSIQLPQKDFIVISKIAQFYKQYNTFYKNICNCARSVTWIILCNAVNSDEIEKQFNLNYQPIVFHFFPSLTAITNYINFPNSLQKTQILLNSFTKIINFKSFQNKFPFILEYNKSQIQKMGKCKNQLWLINKQDLNSLFVNTENNYYFIDEFSVKGDKLQVDCNQDVICIVTQNHLNILNSIGIKNLESRRDKEQMKTNILNSFHSQQSQKTRQKYFRVIIFNIQLNQLKSDSICINKNIYQFRETLSHIQEDCHHLIVMEMGDYTQEREQKIAQAQIIKHVTIEVYLKYGSEFILRSKSSKYTFLKREQLISKITEISSQQRKQSTLFNKESTTFQSIYHNDSDEMMLSEKLDDKNHLLTEKIRSTPSLFEFHLQELFIIIPKTLPYHNLLNRSTQSYSLLVYNNISQIHQFIRHLNKHQFGVIFIAQNENSKNIQNCHSSNYQYITVAEFSEKEIRKQVDSIVERLGFTKRNGSICKYKKGTQTIVLYDSSNSKQSNLIIHINHLFKRLKIITMSKREFVQLKSCYQIAQNLTFYQLGEPQTPSATTIKNITDLFKVYMSPNYRFIRFTAQKIKFSERQIFIIKYYQKLKKEKIKGSLKQIHSSRSLSLRKNSFRDKQHINVHGLTILQSTTLSKMPKVSKFSNKNQLISLTFNTLNKGNSLIIVLAEAEYFQYIKQIPEKSSGIIWVVVTMAIKYCIVRQSHIIFCLSQHIDEVVSQIAQKFRLFKEREFSFGNSHYEYLLQQVKIPIKCFCKCQDLTVQDLKQQNFRGVNLIIDQNVKHLSLQQLGNNLIFGNRLRYQSMLSLFGKQKKIYKKNHQTEQKIVRQTIIILSHAKSRQFIENCLSIIEQQNYINVTYHSLSNLVLYAQITKTLIVLENIDQIKISNGILLNPNDTPSNFSIKLKMFIEALRKSY